MYSMMLGPSHINEAPDPGILVHTVILKVMIKFDTQAMGLIIHRTEWGKQHDAHHHTQYEAMWK